jgi:hypothetical protein
MVAMRRTAAPSSLQLCDRQGLTCSAVIMVSRAPGGARAITQPRSSTCETQ